MSPKAASDALRRLVRALALGLIVLGCRSTPKGLEGPREGDERPPPRPTAGCNQAEPQRGELTLDVGGKPGRYFVSLPPDYDGKRPFPLLFSFHGRARTHTDCRETDCRGFLSEMRDHAVLVFMKSFGQGWERAGELEHNLAFFDAALARMRVTTCFDEGRVFAAGTSSGAHFTNLLACRNGDELRAVAPIAGAIQDRANCRGTPAALVVHGVDDTIVPFADGTSARKQYGAHNGCSDDRRTLIAALHGRVVENRESHECTELVGCVSGAPVAWCEHSEGGYDGSTHGCPSFAGAALRTFFSRF